jgi:hypothetical protein
MGLLIALAIVGLGLYAVYRLFRAWATRVPADSPGTAALLVSIAAFILPIVVFRHSPPRTSGSVAEIYAGAIAGGIANAVMGMMMLTGLALAVLLALAMGLGIRAGARRRAAALDSDAPPR